MSKNVDSPKKKSPLKKLGDAFSKKMQGLMIAEKLSEVVQTEEQEARADRRKAKKDLQKSPTSKTDPGEKTSKKTSKVGDKEVKVEDSATSGACMTTSDELLVKAESGDSATLEASVTSKTSDKPLVKAKSEDSATLKASVTSGTSDKPPVEAKSEESKNDVPTEKSGESDPTGENEETKTDDYQDSESLPKDPEPDSPACTPTETAKKDPNLIDITSPPKRHGESESLGATGGADSNPPKDSQPKPSVTQQTIPKIIYDKDHIEMAWDLKRACVDMYKFRNRFTANQERVEEEINETAPELQKAIESAQYLLLSMVKFQNSKKEPNPQTLKLQNDQMKLLISRSGLVFHDLEIAVGKYQRKVWRMMEETCSSHVEMDAKLNKLVKIMCDDVGAAEPEADIKLEKTEVEK